MSASCDTSAEDLAARWREAFLARLQIHEVAGPLKQASLAGPLKSWTELVTEQVIRSCETLGWCAAGKGFPLDLLPKTGHEYLGLDVMAFDGERRGTAWHFPVAVFELENSTSDERVAYSLWKVLCVRTSLRAVFAYRKAWEPAIRLVEDLAEAVLGGLTPRERLEISGQTLLVLGSRDEGALFPWGYFKCWQLNPNTGRFEKF